MSVDHSPSEIMAVRLVRTLIQAGVGHVVLSPGSRSAPLAYALHAADQAGKLRLHVRLDERSAAFMALGLSRAGELGDDFDDGQTGDLAGDRRGDQTGDLAGDRPGDLGAREHGGESSRRPTPVAVVTTSGSAAAHLHPAATEADAAGIPLVFLTADRPHEMRGTGANQTTDQVGMLGPGLRHVVDIPASAPTTKATTQHITRAVVAARGLRTADPGPVHINVAFRDPLIPAPPATVYDWGSADHRPPASVAPVAITPTAVPVTGRTVVIAGDRAGRAAHHFATEAGVPLLAEPSSDARFGPCAIGNYRALLDGGLGDDVDHAIVFGHPTLWRPVNRLLARVTTTVVAPIGQWTDVAGTASTVIPGPITLQGSPAPARWLEEWKAADKSSHSARSIDPTSMQAVAQILADAHAISPDIPLLVGASRLIRELDQTRIPDLAASGQPARVLSNRGLAGIDGTVSVGLGLATATGRPVRVACGDLTFLHDATGLLRGKAEADADLQIDVVDDDGGGIFAGLEHADFPGQFERLFGTPQDADFEHLAAGMRAAYLKTDVADLPGVLAAPITGRSLVHITVPRPTVRHL